MVKPTTQYMTVEEVAAHYRKPVGTIRYWRHKGIGPKGVKAGTTVLYPLSEVERYDRELAEQKPAPGPTAA